MAADLREMQENQGFSEIQIDKFEFNEYKLPEAIRGALCFCG